MSHKVSSRRVFAWHTPFLHKLREAGSVLAAAKAAGISRKTAYWHRRVNTAFATKWDAAKDAFWTARLDAGLTEIRHRLGQVLARR